jgi:cation diffusion facilitator family transporter
VLDDYARTQKLSAAWNSIFLTLLLIGVKLAVGLSTNSLGILSQASENGFDLIALVVTLLAVRVSTLPPDEDHSYGHGKFENLSALIQAILLLGVTGIIILEAIHRLASPEGHSIVINTWTFVILVASIIIDAGRTRLLRKMGKEHNSQALEANALHFLMDLFSSAVVLIGLLLVRFFNLPSADAWAAILVSIFVTYLSVRLGKKAIDGLTDRFAEKAEYEGIRASIESVSGVESIRRLRVRQAGPYYFIDVTVEVDRTLPYATLEVIVKTVEQRIVEKFERSDITVRWYPVRTSDETPFETLKLITSEFGLSPHNVELTRSERGELLLDYHVEFPPKTGLEEAHRIGKSVEGKLMEQLPQLSKVTSHLEEERSDVVPATIAEVTQLQVGLVEQIENIARSISGVVQSVEDVRLTEEVDSKAFKLVLTLDLQPSISLSDAHTIATKVESHLRRQFPQLGRIVVHVKPI